MKKKEIILVSAIYIIFLFTGIIIFKDYGISVDEWELRELGFANLKYVVEFIFGQDILNIDKILSTPEISSQNLYTHGAIFALPMAFLEYFFNITDSQKYYFLRHYFNHFIFLISNFYFFLLVKERFNSWIYGIIGALFLFLSPRIFAESFYNHKDILFLSIFIINIYYAINFLRFPLLKNAILLSLFTAISIDIRIMGVIIIPIILTIAILKYTRNKNPKILSGILIYLFLFPTFTIIFWPYLWSSPLNNFIQIFKSLGAYGWEGYNLYFGNYYKGSNTPWHYIFVWLFITTPMFYLILFSYGFVNFTLRLKNRIFKIAEKNNLNDFWRGDAESEDLIFPPIVVILLDSTIYNGWRHLYFIYPCFLMISLKGLYLINIKYFKKRRLISNLLTSLLLVQISFNMIKDHPHQNTYFNLLAGKNVEKNFELDYWGLSNKQAFEYILNIDKSDSILIGSAGPISLENSKKILNLNHRNRIVITNNLNADYIIDNYSDWHGNIKKEEYLIPNSFVIFEEIFVSGKRILSIYKKI